MLENFQLAVIAKRSGQTRLYQIPLHQGLQETLAESWGEQYASFVNNIQEIDFDAGYNPEDHERFRLEAYELPVWLQDENQNDPIKLAIDAHFKFVTIHPFVDGNGRVGRLLMNLLLIYLLNDSLFFIQLCCFNSLIFILFFSSFSSNFFKISIQSSLKSFLLLKSISLFNILL